MTNRPRLAPFFAVAALALLGAAAPTVIEFPHGASSTSIKGGIARGETTRYTFAAHADQWVGLKLQSVENNTVARVYAPGWKIDASGEVVPGGDTPVELGADAGTDSWSDLLPATGTYLVELGTTRGGAEFTLNLTIRKPLADDCQELPQQSMNICYAGVERDAEAARTRAYAALEGKSDPKERASLAAVERAWHAYLDADCEYEAAGYEGGSLQPTIRSTCRIQLIAEREAELKRQLQALDQN